MSRADISDKLPKGCYTQGVSCFAEILLTRWGMLGLVLALTVLGLGDEE